jgi:hypothetical protein
MIINDLVRPVIGKLRQRTELAGVLPYYIAQAIIELTTNIEFEDLKITGPISNFVPMQAEYPINGYDKAGITGNPFIQATDDGITFITSWFVYFDQSGVPTPGISTGREIDKRDLRVVEPMSKVIGIPSFYTIHGDKKTKGVIIVGQMPDNPYACQMRYQRRHPFNVSNGELMQAQYNTNLAAKLGQSLIYMPLDWTDIIVYAAAEKACDDIGLNEIGQQYHQKLFGYKDKKGNEMPGLIIAKQTQEERNASFNSRALRVRMRRYTG